MMSLQFLPLVISVLMLPQTDTTARHGGVLNESVISTTVESVPGLVRVDQNFLGTVPAMAGERDILRAAQLVPGISSSREGDVGIVLRGGDFDQTSYLIDFAQVYKPFHLRGFVSSFHPDIIQYCGIYKGGLPPEYGERLSGIMDVVTKDGDMLSYHGGLSVGMLAASAYAEGPILKDKLSFVLAARKSYFKEVYVPLLRRVAQENKYLGQFSGLGFYDLSGKLTYRLSQSDYIRVTLYHGRDNSDLGSSREKGRSYIPYSGFSEMWTDYDFRLRQSLSWGNSVLGARWTHTSPSGSTVQTYAYYSFYGHLQDGTYEENSVKEGYLPESSTTLTTISEKQQKTTSSLSNTLGTLSLGSVFTMSKGIHSLTLGASLSRHSILIKEDNYVTGSLREFFPDAGERTLDSPFLSDFSMPFVSASASARDLMTLGKYFNLDLGARLQLYGAGGRTFFVPEPRVTLSYLPTPAMKYSVGYSRSSQAIHMLQSANVMTPSDLIVPVSGKFSPEIGDQLFAEANLTLLPGEEPLRVILGGYYKSMRNLLEYKESSVIDDASLWEDNVTSGSGRAYGVEVSAQKSIGPFSMTLGYTWSKSLRRFEEINDGKEFYAAHDRRNDLSALFQYKLNSHWDFSAHFTWNTGDRFTLAHYIGLGNISFVQDPAWLPDDKQYLHEKFARVAIPVQVYMERNNYRFNDYHRLDVSANYHFGTGRLRHTVNMSIYNVYNHHNPYTVMCEVDESGKARLSTVCIFPFMPSVNYTLRF